MPNYDFTDKRMTGKNQAGIGELTRAKLKPIADKWREAKVAAEKEAANKEAVQIGNATTEGMNTGPRIGKTRPRLEQLQKPEESSDTTDG
jgi:hypothetical protein